MNISLYHKSLMFFSQYERTDYKIWLSEKLKSGPDWKEMVERQQMMFLLTIVNNLYSSFFLFP